MQAHAQTYTHTHTQRNIVYYSRSIYRHLSVHEHIHGDKYKEVGVPPLSLRGGGWGSCKHFVCTLSTPWQDSTAHLKSIGQRRKILFEKPTIHLLRSNLEKMLTAEPAFPIDNIMFKLNLSVWLNWVITVSLMQMQSG